MRISSITRRLMFSAFSITFFALLGTACGESPKCSIFVDRLDCIPDLTQTDPSARFPYGGVHYCAPSSVSNSIVWLAQQGFEKLMPSMDGRIGTQADLARLIGSEKYMNTTLDGGTSPSGLLIGIARYVRDCGYLYERLEYQGWRKHPKEFGTGVSIPDLEWIKSGLLGDSAVWLNFGWYLYDQETEKYKRIGGHWVTLVGFGRDRSGKENPNVLIIHDPSTKGGMLFRNEYVYLHRMKRGTFLDRSGNIRDAAGYFKLGGDVPVTDRKCGILDGAIVLEMKRS